MTAITGPWQKAQELGLTNIRATADGVVGEIGEYSVGIREAPAPPADVVTRDRRPALGGWRPGYSDNICGVCGRKFIGDKTSSTCATCAYYYHYCIREQR